MNDNESMGDQETEREREIERKPADDQCIAVFEAQSLGHPGWICIGRVDRILFEAAMIATIAAATVVCGLPNVVWNCRK